MGKGFRVVFVAIVLISGSLLAPRPCRATPGDERGVPPAAQLSRAEATIKKLFRDEYQRRAPADRQALAKKLLAEGQATPNDAAARYVCYREAHDLATLGGDLPTAFAAASAIAGDFAVDPKDVQKMKAASYIALARQIEPPDANADLAELGLNLLDQMAASENFDDVDRLLAAIDAAAGKSKQLALVTRAQARRDEVTDLRRDYQKVLLADETLKKTPDDPDADLVAGRHLAFVKGAWDEALPMLAKSSDAALRKLAKLELTRPAGVKAALQLADGWWALSQQQTGNARSSMEKHAQDQYRRIWPSLTGADAARVQARLPTAAASTVSTSSPQASSPQASSGQAPPSPVVTPALPAAPPLAAVPSTPGGNAPPAVTPAGAYEVRTTLKGHGGSVMSVAFSPDGKTLASAGIDNTVRLWDIATGNNVTTFQGNVPAQYVDSLAFSPDGKTLAGGSTEKTIKLWDVATGNAAASLVGHSGWVSSVAFSPDGKTLASGGYGDIKLWDAASGRNTITLAGHPRHQVACVAFSPDGTTLASGSEGGPGEETIKLWDVATGRQTAGFKGHAAGVWSLAFSPDGKVLASGSIDKTVKLWDVAAAKERATLAGHTESVWSVEFRPDGKVLASGSRDGTIKLWETASGQERATLPSHVDNGRIQAVRCIAFSPDGTILASGGFDKTIKLWAASSK